jgi:membrane protein
MGPSDSVSVIKQTASEFSDDNCPAMAGALAFYTAISLPPLLVLIVTVAGFFWSPDEVRGGLEQQVVGVIGQGGWEQMQTMMERAQESQSGVWATALSILVLIFGATGVMVQLQSALNQAWQVEPDPQQNAVKGFLLKRIMSLAMILGIAFLLLVSLVLTAVLNTASDWVHSLLPVGMGSWVPHAINFSVSLVIFTLLFAAMMKWLPDAEVQWKQVWVGAIVTALLFMAGKFGLALYLGRSDQSTYGAASSFVLILLWVYYSGMIFLFGAEFTQVWARRHGAAIEPSKGAVAAASRKKMREETQSHRPGPASAIQPR